MLGRLRLFLVCVLLFGTAACATVPGQPAREPWSLAEALGWLPSSALNGDEYAFLQLGNLDLASELAKVARPDDGTDTDSVLNWALEMSGIDAQRAPVSVPLPEATVPRNLFSLDDIEAELGYSVANVRSFAEIVGAEGAFSVLEGEFSEEDLFKAMGNRQDGVWRLGPKEDGDISLADATAARPLGESLRLALNGSRLAVARVTPPIQEWLSGGGANLGTHTVLRSMAAALDERGVYAAMLVPNPPASDPSITDEMDVVPDSFDSYGTGLALDDRGPLLVLVYHHASDAAAAANVEKIRAVITDGSDGRRPWSDRFRVDDVSASGPVVTATLRLTDEARPAIAWQILQARSSLFQHS